MTTYVLVPGAWIGGWAYAEVADLLRAEGHEVHAVTLSGLDGGGDAASIDLETHIADVTAVIGDREDVVLVGHSYAGMVITGVADRVGERLAKLVYLDSAPFENGESMLDFSGPIPNVDDRFPFPSFEALSQDAGIDKDTYDFLSTKAVGHPYGSYEQPLRISDKEQAFERVVIACDDFRGLVATGMPRFQQFVPPAWKRVDIDTGHWPMITTPKELAAILAAL
ncbi:alpha/beta hydrolase [Allokutzneria sp. A3M-2-11 16]|uniref:alpha/beta fold hydrolase n=1 Tax=Allokutzneria sp. A3M-2-11 16 TaxID=2962043 RepID=UPI0020B8FD74|nr:alpha/beta hydrolase [Allokutzneria sp. A3M-2-11 16]MCP3801658.1 alpha/beta hydrolase [Allokutzneria sp. A3M-2-11 16]